MTVERAPDPRCPDTVLAAYAPGLLDRVRTATTLDELATANAGHGGLVRILSAVGLPVMAVARVVGHLNAAVMDRLFHLTLPPDWHDQCCLIVMGSEGRGEQLLKTDQDNGLIQADGFDPPDLPDRLADFSAGLARLGWPPCKGHVMVTNPAWVMTEGGWADAVRGWIHRPGDTGYMNLSIFADAAPVAGRFALLDGLRHRMQETMTDSGIFFAQFARIALQFETPLGWFGHLVTEHGSHRGRLDVKKGGIFPIVHGIRALSLEARIGATHTLDRLSGLVAAGRLDMDFAIALREAFEFLVGLRLKARLTDPDPGSSDNLVVVDDLAPDERQDLRHAFRTVKQFKDVLTYHYHLEMF